MNNPILFALIVGIITIPILILYQNRKTKSKKKTFTQYEVAALNRLLPIISSHKWCVIIGNRNEIKLDFEDDNLGKIGYHIYSNYRKQLMENNLSAYIKNNIENTYLKIVTDKNSESMIGVDHPTHGHIGYLSFIEVNQI